MGRRLYWLVTYGAELLYRSPDFFDSALLRVTIVTINRGQIAEVSSRMVSAKNARHNKMRRRVRYVFLAVLRSPNFPGKGTAIFPFSFFYFFFFFFNISMVLSVVIDMCYP